MKSVYLILALFVPVFAFANARSTSSAEIAQRQNAVLIDTLRTSAAQVSGNFSVDRNIVLSSQPWNGMPVNLTLQQNEPLGFNVNENSLSIYGNHALRVRMRVGIQDVDFYVNDISFDERNGFRVRVDSTLWWNLGGNEVANEVKRQLENLYGAKMRAALHELQTLRRQRTINDAGQVMTHIMGIFNDPHSTGQAALFRDATIRGDVGVTITARQRRNVDLGEAQLLISPGSSLSASTDFSLRNNALSITRVSLSASDINVVPTGGDPNGPVRVTGGRISLTREGLESVFDSPAETEVIRVTAVIAFLSSLAATGSAQTIVCPPGTRVQFIQDMISERVRPQLRLMIRQHRQQFLQAGIDPQILNALD